MMTITEQDYPKPILMRMLGGSRAWGLETNTSDTDYVVYYDSTPSPQIPPQFFARRNALRLLPTQAVSPDIWMLSNFYSPEIYVSPRFRSTLDTLLGMRERLVMASPRELYRDVARKVDMYRKLYDTTTQKKYLMYLKFWCDWGRDIFDLGPEACYNRSDAAAYRELRLAELPPEQVQNIIRDAVAFTQKMPEQFQQPGDEHIYDELTELVASYYEKNPPLIKEVYDE